MFNRLVTRHAPFLRRMFGQPDVYRLDDCIAAPRFASEEGYSGSGNTGGITPKQSK